MPVRAEIRFEEVTHQAGMEHSGHSFGAAWGDVDGDGWPDLWVGNHYSPPSLYLNQRDGSFIDIAPRLGLTASESDAHGAAWADFDNDGDQDLLELTGAGSGSGSEPNNFYVNEDGRLRESAAEYGLDLPLGRGRTPLWFDADGDGRLDVLLINMPRPDQQASSAVFAQTDRGFEKLESGILRKSLLEKVRDKVAGSFKGSMPGWMLSTRDRITPHGHYAQIAALADPARLDLLILSSGFGLGIYSTASVPFRDISDELTLPQRPIDGVQDIAVEDFDGDGQRDLFLARTENAHSRSFVFQDSASSVRGNLNASGETQKTVCLRTDGALDVQLHPRWTTQPTKLLLGSAGTHPRTRHMHLSPGEPRVIRTGAPATLARGETSIDFNPQAGEWCLRSRAGQLNFIIDAHEPIQEVITPDFEPSQGEAAELLLLQRDQGFELSEIAPATGPRPCQSVVAGDFDNDMDVDLYVVCSGPAGNMANVLYENDGHGRFTPVPNAGGGGGKRAGPRRKCRGRRL